MYEFGEIEPKVWVASLKTAISFVSLATRNKNGAVALLGSQAFQRGSICRNPTRDDDARSKRLEEKPWVPAGGPWVPAGGPWVPAGGVNCSLYAAMEFSSSFYVLRNLLWPSTGPKWRVVLSLEFLHTQQWELGLDFISSGPNPISADNTCSWESRCFTPNEITAPKTTIEGLESTHETGSHWISFCLLAPSSHLHDFPAHQSSLRS